jgi:RNA polymerase sigma-70 factor (ECF subfamily)
VTPDADPLGSQIAAAVAGDGTAAGSLLERYRGYMQLLARAQIGQRLQGKVDAADVVQDVFLDAHRQFPQFRGRSAAEFTGWLRTLLAGHLAAIVRRFVHAESRNVGLEREIRIELDSSSGQFERTVSSGTSPSDAASRQEELLRLADALDRLPADYREAVLLRQIEGLPFAEVAARMGRTVDSVQKLWVRGLEALRAALGPGRDSPSAG